MYSQHQRSSNFILKNKYPILVTIAFFLITSYVAAFHHNYWVIDHDGQNYLYAGQEILAGNGSNVKLHNAPIGGPVIYAFLNQFFDNGFGVMKSIAVLSASGAVFFSYYILNNIFNRKIALVGQLFFAFNPFMGFFAIQAENELLQIFLVAASFYFITKKELKLQDIVICGILLGIASTIRLQVIVVLISFIIFLFLRSRKLRKNFLLALTMLLIFLFALSPVILYNYTTHESIFDTNAAWSMQYHNKYQYPEWQEKMLELNFYNGSTLDAIFVDTDLFFKNYFYNLFYGMPDKLFNFNSDRINSSLINTVPLLGLLPVTAGFIYSFKIKINKNNLIIISSSAIVTALLIFLMGDINVHFFAIIGIPLFLLGLFNIKNVQNNALPLFLLPIIFVLFTSLLLLRAGEHFFLIWFSMAMLAGVFFADVLPQLFKKIRPTKIKLNSKKITFSTAIIISLILLSNFGYCYVLFTATHTNVPFVSIGNEFAKLSQNIPAEQPGMEIKTIGDILNKQPNIENSYVMIPAYHYAYYINGNTVYGEFSEGISDDTFENYVTRKNWKDVEIFHSNIVSQPMDRQNINNPKPDYLIYVLNELDGGPNQHEYLKNLANPESSLIPENFEVLYFSSKSNITHVIYKINYENGQAL